MSRPFDSDYRPSGHDVVVGKPFVDPPVWITVVDEGDPRIRWDRNGLPYLQEMRGE